MGSFLNVAIFRAHEDEKLRGRSKCMKCEIPIGAKDLVPVLSYLLLKGRCRNCKQVFSWQYPAVELATGLLFIIPPLIKGGLGGVSFDLLPILIRDWVFISFLIIIFVYDLKHMLILDRFTIPAMIFALIANLWIGIIPAWLLLLGAVVLAGFFYIQFLISKGKWIGGGDIRLGALMGFMLGLQYGLVALFLGYVFGAVFGLILMALNKANKKTMIPLGTFLTISTLITLFYGHNILDWYLGFFV